MRICVTVHIFGCYRTFKMRNRIFILTVLLTFLLTSCDDSQPDITFDSPFPKRKKNLQWKLGDQFSILKNNDTITYRITFNHIDRENYIINNNTNDTIFAGTVSKYRGLYYFDHQINDTTYWISAVDIDKDIFNMHNTIRGLGLGTAFQQMLLLNNEIEQGNLKKLIKYTDPDKNIIRLHIHPLKMVTLKRSRFGVPMTIWAWVKTLRPSKP